MTEVTEMASTDTWLDDRTWVGNSGAAQTVLSEPVVSWMTSEPLTIEENETIFAAAKLMRDADVGDLIVTSADKIYGIITDRDIVVRALADGDTDSGLPTLHVGEYATTEVVTLSPQDTVERAIALMSEHAVRRLIVAEEGRPIGVVSLGDLAAVTRADDALTEISHAPANN